MHKYQRATDYEIAQSAQNTMFGKKAARQLNKANVLYASRWSSKVERVIWTFQTKRFISEMYLAQDCHLQWPLALHQEGKKDRE